MSGLVKTKDSVVSGQCCLPKLSCAGARCMVEVLRNPWNWLKLIKAIAVIGIFFASMTLTSFGLLIAAAIAAAANGVLTGLIAYAQHNAPWWLIIAQMFISAAITFGLLLLFGGMVAKVDVVAIITALLEKAPNTMAAQIGVNATAYAPLIAAPLVGDGAARLLRCLGGKKHDKSQIKSPNKRPVLPPSLEDDNKSRKVRKLSVKDLSVKNLSVKNLSVKNLFESIDDNKEQKKFNELIVMQLDLKKQKEYVLELVNWINGSEQEDKQCGLDKFKNTNTILFTKGKKEALKKYGLYKYENLTANKNLDIHIRQLWHTIAVVRGVIASTKDKSGDGPEGKEKKTHPYKKKLFGNINIEKLQCIAEECGDGAIGWYFADLHKALSFTSNSGI